MPAHVEDSDEVSHALYAAVDQLGELNALLAVALPQLCKSLDVIATAIKKGESK